MSASAPAPAAVQDPALSARIPYAFAQAHGVLVYGRDGDDIVLLLRPDATVDGIAEVRRIIAGSLVTRSVAADAFAAELARAYNQGGAGAIVWNDDGVRGGDLARLLQELPQAEDLLDSGT